MHITGIICEYNPLHLGHQRQFEQIRSLRGGDSGIVCLMSGNYVQRGEPAVLDKSSRAEAAVGSGADLVLELPAAVSLSSAEGFAAGGVRILSPFCQELCFGAETDRPELLMQTAEALLSPAFPPALRKELDKGLSFPAARQRALEGIGLEAGLLVKPNNILAVEYCKAILSQNSPMAPLPIRRQGDYHAQEPDPQAPSATALRGLMTEGLRWLNYVPPQAHAVLADASIHTLQAGELAILMKLRTMEEGEFQTLPHGSEGLWRKLMHAARQEATLEGIFTALKSKRYPRTRLNRMVLCAFLGLDEEAFRSTAPYVRVLAFNDRGRELLKTARQSGTLLNAGEPAADPYWETERRLGDLYGLFAAKGPEAPGAEARRRIRYLP